MAIEEYNCELIAFLEGIIAGQYVVYNVSYYENYNTHFMPSDPISDLSISYKDKTGCDALRISDLPREYWNQFYKVVEDFCGRPVSEVSHGVFDYVREHK